MVTRLAFVFVAAHQVTGMNFHTIDVDALERTTPLPIHLENKVFTEDGLDVTHDLMAEASREEADLEAGKAAMDNEFDKIRNSAFNGVEMKLQDLVKYTPKLRKIDIN